MSTPTIPTPKIQPLTRQDGVKIAIRHIGQKRRHIFTECNHTIEDDHCMYPPEHTEMAIRQNSRMDTVVRFRGLCNTCEERSLIRRAIVKETKTLVEEHMVGFMNEEQARSLTEKSVRWAKNRLIINFKYKQTGQTDTIEEDAGWGMFSVIVSPTSSDHSSTGGYQWEEVYVDISSSPTLIHAQLDIQTHVYAFERKWNTLIKGSSGGRGSFANRSSETDLSSVFPPFPELLPQGARVLEDHFRYDDPDLLETLPFSTPEDFSEEL